MEENAQFAPVGSILLTVTLLLLGGAVLFFAEVARRGGPERNVATADRQDLRSVIWTSAETWQAAHRAHAPWLFTAAAGVLTGGVVGLGANIAQGAVEAVGTALTVTCVALVWAIVLGTVAGIRGRTAARRVLARGVTGR